MGRFTLRDEGRTICTGKVLKYKPYDSKSTASIAGGSTSTGVTASGPAGTTVVNKAQEEMVYDMDTGEMRPKKPDLEKIAEGDEDDDN